MLENTTPTENDFLLLRNMPHKISLSRSKNYISGINCILSNNNVLC